MLRYMVPLIFVLTSANSWQGGIPRHQFLRPDLQVASASQVKFALENHFDDTGPGAKQPEYAYNTYKNLEEALVGYLNDPDTKLPEHERVKAITKLLQQNHNIPRAPGGLFKKDERFNLLQQLPLQYQNTDTTKAFNLPIGKHFYDQDSKIGKIAVSDINEVTKTHQGETKVTPFRFQKIHKGIPLSIAHYTRDYDQKMAHEQFDAHPKYVFSYGVHDKITGDLKSAQEIRDGGYFHGYYSVLDSNGKTRTVHYTRVPGERPDKLEY